MRRIAMRQRMSRGVCGTILVVIGAMGGVGCADLLSLLASSDGTIVRIRLINDSVTQYVAPNLGVCPNGMASTPHYFVTPTPVIAPGREATYTTRQIAGADGSCSAAATDLEIGLCGWEHGASEAELTSVGTRFGGKIGFQFGCGDTVILRWSDAGGDDGTWTSEVEPAAGNDTPTADFQEL